MKICVSCRAEINDEASVCPHCRSDVAYKYFVKIPNSLIIKNRFASFKIIIIIIEAIFVSFIGITAFLLFGFWLGVGAVLLSGGIFSALGKDITNSKHNDGLTFTCPGCSHIDNYYFESDTLVLGKKERLICGGCSQISQIEIT